MSVQDACVEWTGNRQTDVNTAMLQGPYNLSFDDLELVVPGHQCGVYALGHLDSKQTFRVHRIGRDDHDLRQRLRDLIGSSMRFKFASMTDPQQAFVSECELFHRLRPPGNIIHPERKPGSDWRCPICSQYRIE